jgi:hypothetical protein
MPGSSHILEGGRAEVGNASFASKGLWPTAVPAASAQDWIARRPNRPPRDGKHYCGENDCFPVHVEDIFVTPQSYGLPNGEFRLRRRFHRKMGAIGAI